MFISILTANLKRWTLDEEATRTCDRFEALLIKVQRIVYATY